jgi:L-ascorbate metabolism protein UlaG (beta-lactamase superfamily)
MEINWYGHSCFRLSERGMASVVTDPYDSKVIGYEPLKLKADIVTVSHDSPGHNNISAVKGTGKGDPKVITGQGEYEIGEVFITGIQTDGMDKKHEGEIKNTLYVFDYYGLTVAHMGDMTRVPTQAEVESLGPVHIALIPVGAGGSLNAAKAAEVVSLLEPSIVIPMHYATEASIAELEPLSKFIKEMGLTTYETVPFLKITKPSLPEETKVFVLEYDRNRNGSA